MPRVLPLSLLLLALALGTFRGAPGHGFISLDDYGYVLENPAVRRGLSWEGIRWALTTTYAANWHPLTWVSHMVDVDLFGMDAGAHHAVSVALHGAGTVLLFLVLRGMTGALWRSALAAALFAAHPLHVESVAWVSERKDVLSTLFWWLTLGAYLRYVRRPSPSALVAALAACALGLMAKPMLVTLPFVLLLLDWWPLGRWRVHAAAPARRGIAALLPPLPLWREKVPFFFIAAAASWLTYRAQSLEGATASWRALTFPARVANAADTYVAYLARTMWPADLSVFYPHPVAIPPWTALGVDVAVLGGVTLAALFLRRPHPSLAAGWFWYLGTLVPVIGLVQVGTQAMADRYTYVPLVGVFLAGAWGLAALIERGPALRLPAAACVAAALLVLAAAASDRHAHWRDSVTLFGRALALDPGNYVAHHHLGLAAEARGDSAGAAGHYREALRLKPDYGAVASRLAGILAAQGGVDEAVGLYRTALRVEPGATDVRNGLGVALVQRGDLGGAIGEFQETLLRDPGHGDARFNLAKALVLQGKAGEAAVHLGLLAERSPGDPGIQLELGNAYLLLERQDEARTAWKRARAIDPSLAGSPLCLGQGDPWCGLFGTPGEGAPGGPGRNVAR